MQKESGGNNQKKGKAVSNSKREAPAFQLYVDDFIGGTYWMTNEEIGAYIRLLMYQWTKHGLPDEASVMASVINERGMDEETFRKRFNLVLNKFFKDEDGMLRNSRLEKQRKERTEYLEKLREKGLKGSAAAKARHDKLTELEASQLGTQKGTQKGSQKGTQKGPKERGTQKGTQKGPSPTPTPTPTPNNQKPASSENGKGSAKEILDYINRCQDEGGTGVKYKATVKRLDMIGLRVKDVSHDVEGMKQTYKRWSTKWKGTQYANGLAPEHFFGSEEKFLGYYEHRSLPTGSEEEKRSLQAQIDEIEDKFLNDNRTFESEHRNANGSLKPESAKKLKELKGRAVNG